MILLKQTLRLMSDKTRKEAVGSSWALRHGITWKWTATLRHGASVMVCRQDHDVQSHSFSSQPSSAIVTKYLQTLQCHVLHRYKYAFQFLIRHDQWRGNIYLFITPYSHCFENWPTFAKVTAKNRPIFGQHEDMFKFFSCLRDAYHTKSALIRWIMGSPTGK